LNPAEADLTYLGHLTLLYVEDVDLVREHTCKVLEPLVGRLILAGDAASGLEAFRTQHPDLVLTDLVISDGDGLAMAEAIRALAPAVPIIVTTTHDDISYLVRAIELGVAKVVFKPVAPEALQAALLVSAHRLAAEEQLVRKRQLDAEALRFRHQAAMSELGRGMGHDFNNLLQGVLGALSVAKFSTPATNPLHGILDMAERSANQARELARRLICLAKGGKPLNHAGSLSPLLRSTVDAVLRGTAITVRFEVPETLPAVVFDEQDLHLLVDFLVANARDAMPSGGTLAITAVPFPATGDEGLGLVPGNYVRYTFQDSGPGIAPENLERIFEPNFSTKETKGTKGVGLSLTLCRAIARTHRGALTAESLPGQGAALHLYLEAGGSIPT
jgi:signal transduction histidine kinase